MFLAYTCVYVTSLELDDFRTPAWTDESLETVFDLYRYSSTTNCDQTDSNSSCAKVRKDNNNASFHSELQ